MKILQVNCVYGHGSTGKITRDIHHALLARGFESVACYGRGPKAGETGVHRTCNEIFGKANNLISRVTGLMYGGCHFSTRRLMRIIEKEQPDVVHLHCINGYFVNIYSLIQWLKEKKIKTVLTLHAEFMHTANCGHALDCEKWKTGCGNCPRLRQETLSWGIDNTALSFRKMKAAFDGFVDTLQVVSVSPWLMERAKQSPILEAQYHSTILNGIDTTVFHPVDTAGLREELGLRDEKIIFHATADFQDDPNHLKGGYYVLRLAERLKADNVKILVAGDHPAGLQVPENVILLGKIADQYRLAQFYTMADLTVISSRRETFSLVVAESLCCGTPVAGFKAGGPEMIAVPAYSRFCNWADVDTLEENVRIMLESTGDTGEIAEIAAKKYAKETMCDNYIDLYLSMNGA